MFLFILFDAKQESHPLCAKALTFDYFICMRCYIIDWRWRLEYSSVEENLCSDWKSECNIQSLNCFTRFLTNFNWYTYYHVFIFNQYRQESIRSMKFLTLVVAGELLLLKLSNKQDANTRVSLYLWSNWNMQKWKSRKLVCRYLWDDNWYIYIYSIYLCLNCCSDWFS